MSCMSEAVSEYLKAADELLERNAEGGVDTPGRSLKKIAHEIEDRHGLDRGALLEHMLSKAEAHG